MKPKTKRILKITLTAVAGLLAAVILAVGSYVLYVVGQYSRIPDNTALEVVGEIGGGVERDRQYSILTYNIGFGAYGPDYSFFMDTGVMKDGRKTQGKYGKGLSYESVRKNTDGSLNAVEKQDADFVLLQEVDEKADRSYKINQLAEFRALQGYNSVYACNFHSAYLFYPFNDPHGASNAGLVTLSKYKINSALRRSYPISTGFSKFLDLDRAFSVCRCDLEDGKQLVLVNSHMSAYDKGGTIRAEQLAFLNEFLKEEKTKDNYVIVGGDFNHDIADSAELFESQQKRPEWVYDLTDEDLTEGYKIAAATNAPTCRGADIPYEKGVDYTVVIDGFIVSDNVEVTGIENIDLDFAYSDHNPARMTFKLK